MAVIGPGMGTLIGLAWAEEANDRADRASQRQLRKSLVDAEADLLMAKATRDSSVAVLNAVMGEVCAAKAGRLASRKYSDPANRAARNHAFVETLRGQLNRLSEGKLTASGMSVAFARTSRLELDKLLRDSTSLPKLLKGL